MTNEEKKQAFLDRKQAILNKMKKTDTHLNRAEKHLNKAETILQVLKKDREDEVKTKKATPKGREGGPPKAKNWADPGLRGGFAPHAGPEKKTPPPPPPPPPPPGSIMVRNSGVRTGISLRRRSVGRV